MLSGDADRVLVSVQTALMEDKNFGGTMPPLQRDILPAFKDFESSIIQFSTKLINTAKFVGAEKGESMANLADRSLESSLAFWTKSADVLDDLIAKWQNDIAHNRFVALTLVTGARVVDLRDKELSKEDSNGSGHQRGQEDRGPGKGLDTEQFSSNLSHRERELDQSSISALVPSSIDANDDSFQKVV